VTTGNEPDVIWAQSVGAVRWSIGELTNRRVHPFFIAYLHLRGRIVSESRESIAKPNWKTLSRYLRLPGGPPKKPHYRPLYDTPGNPNKYWLNENLAGSYSPASLRADQPPMQVVRKTPDGGLGLQSDHAKLALHHLLFDQRLEIYPFASFLYRDFGLLTEGPKPDPISLVDVFKEDWHFTLSEDQTEDFETLFTTNEPPLHLFEESSWNDDGEK